MAGSKINELITKTTEGFSADDGTENLNLEDVTLIVHDPLFDLLASIDSFGVHEIYGFFKGTFLFYLLII